MTVEFDLVDHHGTPVTAQTYRVPHTAIIHLVDPDGQRAAHWADTVAAERITTDLIERVGRATR